MILKTTTSSEFREALETLMNAGFTQVQSPILPRLSEGDGSGCTNYIQIYHKCALFALTSRGCAEDYGFFNYSEWKDAKAQAEADGEGTDGIGSGASWPAEGIGSGISGHGMKAPSPEAFSRFCYVALVLVALSGLALSLLFW